VTDVAPVEQFVEDIPRVKPHVTRIVTYTANCASCGVVRSNHPRQVATATGAAATQLGPRAAALAVDLNKRLGVPAAKTCSVLTEHFDLKLTPGGLIHLEARLASRLEPTYQELARLVRRSAVVHADETSWWVGGPGYWLWVFTNRELTFYVVDKSRGRDVVDDVLGESFAGVLVSDCLAAYEKLSCVQHKCYAHHLRAIAEAKTEQPNNELLNQAEILLKSAIALGTMRASLDAVRYADLVAKLEAWADDLLAPEKPTDHPKIANRLRKRRAHLFTFLRHDGVDATNNAAERAIRPAVIARKVSCGNRTERGKQTWQTLASIAATCMQQRRSFTDFVAATVPLGAPAPTLQPPPPD
jgi:hypothetical protein